MLSLLNLHGLNSQSLLERSYLPDIDIIYKDVELNDRAKSREQGKGKAQIRNNSRLKSRGPLVCDSPIA